MKGEIVDSMNPGRLPSTERDRGYHHIQRDSPSTFERVEPARGVTDQDLVGKNARFMTPADFANLVAEVDRVVSF